MTYLLFVYALDYYVVPSDWTLVPCISYIFCIKITIKNVLCLKISNDKIITNVDTLTVNF